MTALFTSLAGVGFVLVLGCMVGIFAVLYQLVDAA